MTCLIAIFFILVIWNQTFSISEAYSCQHHPEHPAQKVSDESKEYSDIDTHLLKMSISLRRYSSLKDKS